MSVRINFIVVACMASFAGFTCAQTASARSIVVSTAPSGEGGGAATEKSSMQSSGDVMTVKFRGNVTDLLTQVIRARGRDWTYTVAGPVTMLPIEVAIDVKDVSFEEFLGQVAEQLGARADLALDEKNIELRYRDQKSATSQLVINSVFSPPPADTASTLKVINPSPSRKTDPTLALAAQSKPVVEPAAVTRVARAAEQSVALSPSVGAVIPGGEDQEKKPSPNHPSKPALLPSTAVQTFENPSFRILPSDMNVRGSLRRWMKSSGFQDVVWDLRDDIPADREITFDGDLNAALLGLMQALKTGPSPARACMYTNKVVRIIPATRFCEEPTL